MSGRDETREAASGGDLHDFAPPGSHEEAEPMPPVYGEVVRPPAITHTLATLPTVGANASASSPTGEGGGQNRHEGPVALPSLLVHGPDDTSLFAHTDDDPADRYAPPLESKLRKKLMHEEARLKPYEAVGRLVVKFVGIPDMQFDVPMNSTVAIAKIQIEARTGMSIWSQVLQSAEDGTLLHDSVSLSGAGLLTPLEATDGISDVIASNDVKLTIHGDDSKTQAGENAVFCMSDTQHEQLQLNRITCVKCRATIEVEPDLIAFLCPRCRTYHQRPKPFQMPEAQADMFMMLPQPMELIRQHTLTRQLSAAEEKLRESLASDNSLLTLRRLNYDEGFPFHTRRSIAIMLVPLLNVFWVFYLCCKRPKELRFPHVQWHDTRAAGRGVPIGLIIFCVVWGLVVGLAAWLANPMGLAPLYAAAGLSVCGLVLLPLMWGNSLDKTPGGAIVAGATYFLLFEDCGGECLPCSCQSLVGQDCLLCDIGRCECEFGGCCLCDFANCDC